MHDFIHNQLYVNKHMLQMVRLLPKNNVKAAFPLNN